MTSPNLPGGRETILVVDDEMTVRQAVARILERLGYRVLTAPDPREALRLAAEHPVDLLVIDVILPLMSGLTLAHRISQVRPGSRTLYISGYTTEETLGDQELAPELVDFLQKPFTTEELARKVRDLLDRAERTVAPAGPAHGNETVLVVDDDEGVRGSVVRVLEKLGYHVLQAGAPDHALQIALGCHVDLVVMDVVLPRMDGLALAHTISALRPESRVVYISGHAPGELSDDDAFSDPSVRFIRKPFTPHQLGTVAREILDEAASITE